MTELGKQTGKIVKAVVSSDGVTKGGAYNPPGPLATKPDLTPPKPPTPPKE